MDKFQGEASKKVQGERISVISFDSWNKKASPALLF